MYGGALAYVGLPLISRTLLDVMPAGQRTVSVPTPRFLRLVHAVSMAGYAFSVSATLPCQVTHSRSDLGRPSTSRDDIPHAQDLRIPRMPSLARTSARVLIVPAQPRLWLCARPIYHRVSWGYSQPRNNTALRLNYLLSMPAGACAI